MIATKDKLGLEDHLALEKNYNETVRRSIEKMNERFPDMQQPLPAHETLDPKQSLGSQWWIAALYDFDALRSAQSILATISLASELMVYFVEDHVGTTYVACFRDGMLDWQIRCASFDASFELDGSVPSQYEELAQKAQGRNRDSLISTIFRENVV